MEILSLFVNVIGPVFALVAIGAAAGQRLGVDSRSLSKLAYWVLGPAFVFDALATQNLQGGLIARLAFAALVAMAIGAGLAAIVNWVRGASYSTLAATTMTSVYGNVGNAGLAIAVFALGDGALAAAAVLMVVINVTGMVVGIGLASARSQSALSAVVTALTAPMTLGAFAAIAFNIVQRSNAEVVLPLVIERSVGLLAGALIPVMLFGLGMQLVEGGRPQFDVNLVVPIAVKLAIVPAVAAAVGAAIGLGGDDLGVTIIQSAMPPAVFCAVVATEHDLEPRLVTNAVVLTTLISLLTLPVVLVLVG